jgi:hypothetical protein
MSAPVEDITRRGEGHQGGLPSKGEYVNAPQVPKAVAKYGDTNQNGTLIGPLTIQKT